MIADFYKKFRSFRALSLLVTVCLWLSAGYCATVDAAPDKQASSALLVADLQPSLREFASRLSGIEAAIPDITKAAEAAADRIFFRPGTLLDVPYWQQQSFSEEMINRAGGLAHMMPTGAGRRKATGHDVVVMSVRSWETFPEKHKKQLVEWRQRGDIVILIASLVGRPDDAQCDYFIDNGSPDSGAESSRINLLANVTIGWMWCCEYVSAMTRRGKAPAILRSISYLDADEHNPPIQSRDGRHTLHDIDQSIPAGKLAQLYLDRVSQLVTDLASERTQAQIGNAADIIVDRMKAGKKVGVSGVGHIIIKEAKTDLRSPFVGFQAVNLHKKAFTQHLDPGDLLVWIAYIGQNSAYVDFGKYIAEAKVELITCDAPPPGEDYAGPPIIDHPSPVHAVARIDQSWKIGDAEVPIPYKPGRMGPVSGLNAGLILRMLDDTVSERLAASP